MTDPFVAVAPITWEGVSTAEELQARGTLPSESLRLALEKSWSYDAHVLTYFCRPPAGSGGDRFFRVGKDSNLMAVLEEHGFQFLTQTIFLDYDNPGHARWIGKAEAMSWAAQIQEMLGEDGQPYAIYTTAHGARLVYALTEPVPIKQIGGLIAGIIAGFASHGIVFDATCVQWHRMYRLPKVKRDEKESEDDPSFYFILRPECFLDPSILETADMPRREYEPVGTVDYTPTNEPTQGEVQEILYTAHPDKNGRPVTRQTDWHKKAKKRLKTLAPQLAEVMYQNAPVPGEGGRDNWLTRAIGSLISVLRPIEGTTEQHAFAAFNETLHHFEPDEDTPDWHARAWDMLQRFWARDSARLRAEQDQEVKQVEIKLSREEYLIRRLQEKYPQFDALHDPDTAHEWVRTHALLMLGPRTCYLLDWDGNYSLVNFDVSNVVIEVRQRGMEDLIDCWTLTETGRRGKNPRDVANTYGCPISRVEMSCYLTETELVETEAETYLRIPIHRLNRTIVRKFDPEVDGWLRACTSIADYEILERWLVASLETTWPVPLLSIEGVHSSGKSLLVNGIAECFENPSYCDKEALLNWNGPIQFNPVIYIDEGASKVVKQRGVAGLSEEIREVVGGAKLTVKEKFKPQVQVEVNPRVILTANSLKLLSDIIGKRQSEQDLEALRERIVHMRFSHHGARYLAKLGGRQGTMDWIGTNSSHRLAGHILFLWENKRQSVHESAARFLVPGRIDMKTLVGLNFDDEGAHSAHEAILEFVESPATALTGSLVGGRAFAREKRLGAIFVHKRGVQEYIKSRLSLRHWKVSTSVLTAVLDYLSRGQTIRSDLKEFGVQGKNFAVWHRLDLVRLYETYVAYCMSGDDQENTPKNIWLAMASKYGEEETARIVQEVHAGTSEGAQNSENWSSMFG